MERGVIILNNDLNTAVTLHLLKHKLELTPIYFYQADKAEITTILQYFEFPYLFFVQFTPIKGDPLLNHLAQLTIAEQIAKKEFADYIVTTENIPLISSSSLTTTKILNKQVNKQLLRPIFSLTEKELKLPLNQTLELAEPTTLNYETKLQKIQPQLQESLNNLELQEL